MLDGTQPAPEATKKLRLDESAANNDKNQESSFPDDFFSDPSRQLPQPEENEEEDPAKASEPPKEKDLLSSIVDREFEDFLKSVNSTTAPKPDITDEEFDRREKWNRATVIAEPELALDETPEGFPVLGDGQPEPETEEERNFVEERKKQQAKELGRAGDDHGSTYGRGTRAGRR